MLVTNEMLLSTICTASKRDRREAFEQIKIIGNKAIATNGHVIIEIENNTGIDIADFPEFDGIKNTEDEILLHTSEIEKIKKLKVKSSIPILNTVKIGKNDNAETAHITIPGIDNPTTIKSSQTERLEFPDTEKVKESTNSNKKIHTSYISPCELQRILDVAKKVKSEVISLDFFEDSTQWGNKTPVAIKFEIVNETEHKITGLLMPKRHPKE